MKKLLIPSLGKVIIFIIILTLVSFIPKTDKICSPTPGGNLLHTTCETKEVSGFGYPMIYGESFVGDSIVIELNIVNLVVNIIIYYSISASMVYIYMFRKNQIGFALNSVLILVINFIFASLMFPRYIDGILDFNMSPISMIFSLGFLVLFISQILILITRDNLNGRNYKSSFVFAYLSLVAVLFMIYLENKVSNSDVPSPGVLIPFILPILLWLIFISTSWIKLLKEGSRRK